MKGVGRARVIGGSVVITIPRGIVEEEGIRPGELLEIQVEKVKKNFFGAAEGIGSFTKEDEMA